MACQDGYLRQVKAHAFRGDGKGGRAAEYVCNVAACKLLAGKAQPGTAELWQRAGQQG